MVRLQKYLADAGVASRRAGEQVILAGRVAVNGELVRQLGTKVDPVHDRVTVDGKPIRTKRKIYVAVNKPKGYLCTRDDPERRNTIGELLPRDWGNLYTVGRLDKESEGLIFMTNDGEFSLKLTHPRYGVKKLYRVIVQGRVSAEEMARLVQGVRQGPDRLRATRARVLEANNTRSLVEVELAEGKNREVRRMFEVLGREVDRLQRLQIGTIKLGELPSGKWRTLTEPEIRSLLGSA